MITKIKDILKKLFNIDYDLVCGWNCSLCLLTSFSNITQCFCSMFGHFCYLWKLHIILFEQKYMLMHVWYYLWFAGLWLFCMSHIVFPLIKAAYFQLVLQEGQSFVGGNQGGGLFRNSRNRYKNKVSLRSNDAFFELMHNLHSTSTNSSWSLPTSIRLISYAASTTSDSLNGFSERRWEGQS